MEVESTTIVADWGTFTSKFGFAGYDKPRWWQFTITGEPKFQEMLNGSEIKEFYLGEEVKSMRKELNISYPVIDGYVKDWDIMEKMLNFVICENLKSSPEDHPILLSESPFNSDENRLSMWEIMFQGLNTPCFYVQKQGVLALYATDKTNGLVLCSGEGTSNVIPIYEGFAVPHAIQMINIAGSDVTEYLRRLIVERGYKFTTSSDIDTIRNIKEKCWIVWKNGIDSDEISTKEINYELPDKSSITIGNEVYQCPELIFDPQIAGINGVGYQSHIVESIIKWDSDLQELMLSNIVLCGGNTMFDGFGHRLWNELDKVNLSRSKIKILADPERDNMIWKGGSILSALSTFQTMWITRAEYEEWGPTIIYRKWL